MTRLVEPYYYHVGFYELESNPHLTIYSRTDALNWACRLQIQNCTRSAAQEYAALMAEPDLYIYKLFFISLIITKQYCLIDVDISRLIRRIRSYGRVSSLVVDQNGISLLISTKPLEVVLILLPWLIREILD